jgi:uncharacterized C2H2 Zn-finger protein
VYKTQNSKSEYRNPKFETIPNDQNPNDQNFFSHKNIAWLINRYIGVLGETSSSPSQAETPTFETLSRNRYSCSLCKEIVNGVHEKFIHRNKHLARSFHCQFCGTVFPTSIDVVRHVHIMHKNSQKCPKCDYVATDKDSYFSHLDRVHSAPSPTPSAKRKLADDTASATKHKSPKISKKHIAIEVENSSMVCELCPKERSLTLCSQMAYIAHINEVHVMQGVNYPFMCPFTDCFREFEDQETLTKHLGTHTAVRRYK